MFRHSVVQTLTMIALLSLLLATVPCTAIEEGGTGTDGNATDASENGSESEVHEEILDPYAVLFPSLIMTFGVIVYYLLSRYLHALPYTAVMFLLGTTIGLGVSLRVGQTENSIHITAELWQSINSEVLLLVFLPGLIFKDSMGQNPYLFAIAIGQLLIFAFPMVLAGTVLTACIGYYIFPYGWSFNLAMTFGSILSATDPVAVAALLDEVGAPPRLKTHIGGESLLNDGSAIVFYSIFSQRFFAELGVEGFGSEVDLKEGIAMFCQKALGGAAIGLFFGFGILAVLTLLDRRFSKEENLTQVMAVVAIAYVNYFVADFVWKTSGVIATLVAGLLFRYLGRGTINDVHLLDNFFALLEHMLNTVLFSLGGLVYGYVIVLNYRLGIWTAKDFGYLLLLYILLNVMRAVMFVAIYPITVRIGLKTNWPETIFQVYGGLRGAVGIALAISLDNEVAEVTGGNDVTVYEEQTTQVYQMVGGVAFLTLIINGTTAGPLLRWLGLAESSETRKKIIEAYKIHFRVQLIDSFVSLLTNDRFQHVDFAMVRYHVPYLADLTLAQLAGAVGKLKETTPSDKYCPPHLHRVLPYLEGTSEEELDPAVEASLRQSPAECARKMKIAERRKNRGAHRKSSTMVFLMEGEPMSTHDLRILFISMLRAQYEHQVASGELDSQHLLTVALEQSLEEAETKAQEGIPLDDFKYLQEFHAVSSKFAARFDYVYDTWENHSHLTSLKTMDRKQKRESYYVEQAMAFVAAHKGAQAFFKEQFGDIKGELSEAGKIILAESQREIDMANKDLDTTLDKSVVESAVSRKFCKIILNQAMRYIDNLVRYGLLKDIEAEELVEEVNHLLCRIMSCELTEYPGEIKWNKADDDDDDGRIGPIVKSPLSDASKETEKFGEGNNAPFEESPIDIPAE